MKKLYPLSFARDDNVTFLKNSIEISGEIILRAFVVAAIVYSFVRGCLVAMTYLRWAELMLRLWNGVLKRRHAYGVIYLFQYAKNIALTSKYSVQLCRLFTENKNNTRCLCNEGFHPTYPPALRYTFVQ